MNEAEFAAENLRRTAITNITGSGVRAEDDMSLVLDNGESLPSNEAIAIEVERLELLAASASANEITKMQGVVFEGVACSATKDDQNGLTTLYLDYLDDTDNFIPWDFVFSNGNKLRITKDNIIAFRNAWKAFRRSVK